MDIDEKIESLAQELIYPFHDRESSLNFSIADSFCGLPTSRVRGSLWR
jgi:hypothetical protein